ncbi:hypothetical protein E6H16_00590, partial [Candidatus Bathyarchaeota archaeon]
MSSVKGMGEELSKIALETASKENATYTDFRLVNSRNEATQVVNDNPSSEELTSLGVGVRVLYGGLGWGFADTDEMNKEGIREATLKAVALAKGAAKVGIKIQLAKEPSYVDTWLSPLVKDPFNVPMEEKYELLNDCCERMKAEGVVLRRGGFVFTSIEK